MTIDKQENPRQSLEHRLSLFEDRYGLESFSRLMALLNQPCVSFAQIAERFGVTRERVRQWQLKFMPDAPRGHQRQRLCLIQHERRKLLTDPLFRSFYRHARPHLGSGDLVLIRSRDGFRKRVVRVRGRLIIIKAARPARASRLRPAGSYELRSTVMAADFVYYRLTDAEYLVVPGELIPQAGTTFMDGGAPRYQQYRNSFAAVLAAPVGASQDVSAQIGDGIPEITSLMT